MEIKNGGILIIAAPRTGGTNLMKSIGSAYNKKTRFEPDIVKKFPYFNENKDVVKFVPMWFRHIHDPHYFIYYDNILKSAKKFNTIIIINRKNKIEQTESLYVQQFFANQKVSVKWVDSLVDKNSYEYQFLEKYVDEIDVITKKLSLDLDIPIDYYEDVYKNKSLTNKNIKLDLEYFKPKYKLRQDTQSEKLI